MRKIAISFAVFVAMVGVSFADEVKSKTIEAKFTTNITAKVETTDSTINGFVEEIVIDCPISTTTQTVSVTAVNYAGDVIELATNVVAGASQLVVRPRVFTTGVGGVATTTGTKFLLLGETVKFSVTNSTAAATISNQTWKATIKTSRSN
jgi:hypothetical protein